MKRLKRLKPFHDFETAKRICNIVFRPVFDAASHGELGFCSFCCFEVENFHKSMVLRAHPVHVLPQGGRMSAAVGRSPDRAEVAVLQSRGPHAL